jgi:hypothetical protein
MFWGEVSNPLASAGLLDMEVTEQIGPTINLSDGTMLLSVLVDHYSLATPHTHTLPVP